MPRLYQRNGYKGNARSSKKKKSTREKECKREEACRSVSELRPWMLSRSFTNTTAWRSPRPTPRATLCAVALRAGGSNTPVRGWSRKPARPSAGGQRALGFSKALADSGGWSPSLFLLSVSLQRHSAPPPPLCASSVQSMEGRCAAGEPCQRLLAFQRPEFNGKLL